jgi:hypothetical protein
VAGTREHGRMLESRTWKQDREQYTLY